MLEELIEQNCICVITPSNGGFNSIERVADIIDNRIYRFEYDPDESKRFNNRRFFTLKSENNLPTTESGFIGVWTCNAVENRYDATKDYSTSKYCPDLRPIPIVECKVTNIIDLVKEIRKQIVFPQYYRTMLVSYSTNGDWYGIYLDTSILAKKDGRYYIPENTNRLTLYHFSSSDIISINGQKFLAYMNPNRLTFEFVPAKDIEEIVKDKVLGQVNWAVLQQKGYTRDQYSKVRSVLESLDYKDITSKVRNICNCTEDQAKIAVNRFIENVYLYLDGNSLEDRILKSLYARDEELRERLTGIAQAEWEAEISERRKEIDLELDSSIAEIQRINDEIKQKQDYVDGLSQTAENMRSEVNELSIIREKTESELKKIIQTAREDIVSVINHFPVFSALINHVDSASSNNEIGVNGALKPGCDLTVTDVVESPEDTIDLINDSFRKNGLLIGSQELSSFMYSCYLLSIPICLVGPYGKLIVDIFSAAVQHKSATELNCAKHVNETDFETVHNERVVHVTNAFNSAQKDEILEKFIQASSFIVYSIPFKEDLHIEPEGVLNYMIPVFTEDLFTGIPDGTIYVGKKEGEWNENELPSNSSDNLNRMFRRMGCNRYQEAVLSKAISCSKTFLTTNNQDLEYLLVGRSFAFILKGEKVLRKSLKSAVLSSSVKDLLEDYLGDDNDD